MSKYLQKSRAYLGSGLKGALLRCMKEESRSPNLETAKSFLPGCRIRVLLGKLPPTTKAWGAQPAQQDGSHLYFTLMEFIGEGILLLYR